MTEEINKYLTEAIGECWHEFEFIDFEYICGCGLSSHTPVVKHNDFFTWEGFGKLFSWAKGQRWWIDFILTRQQSGVYNFCERLTPEVFARSIYAFLNKES